MSTAAGGSTDNPAGRPTHSSRDVDRRHDGEGAVSEHHGDRSFRDLVARQRAEFGGIKFGSAFFGWLTATGTSVILLALVAAIAAAAGADSGLTPQTATDNAQQVGLVGGIIVAVVLFIAYYCGGYVAGRMARFNGLKQGLAVWLWAVLIIVVLALVGAVVGSSSDVLRQVSFPQIPATANELTASGIIALAVLLAAALVGALLGGLAGMRFHRKVDKATFDPRL
ncbi:MAG TPA: hypothetical protein VFP89_03000 [Propionibacteriaceae bacterium]|nr:hypothetical protein [Propionibacteriaceae bacterium]